MDVSLKKFSNNDPLDYAQLNDMVDAIIEIAAKMSVIQTPASSVTGTITPGQVEKTITVVGAYTIKDCPKIGTAMPAGKEETFSFKDSDGNPVTFVSRPMVCVTPRSTTGGKGLPMLYLRGVNTSNFAVRGAWTAPREANGDIAFDYIAVGRVVSSK